MWFGIKNGLNCFDGIFIVQMNCDDYVVGIGNYNIFVLFEDKECQLWVGMDRGVYCYNFVLDIFMVMNMEIEEGVNMNNWVFNIVVDFIGNIWIVIFDQGVFCYKDEKFYFYEVINKEYFKIEVLDCILVCFDGDVWVGIWGVGFF